MTALDVIESLARFPTGNLCNAHPEVRAMSSSITPLYPGAKVCGPAKTVKIEPGQNRAIHRAVHTAEQYDVLVVDGGHSYCFGPFGDILATGCINQGITGLVIDSTIRDAGEITGMGFPVFCLGTNPSATVKTDPGEIDISITCGGVEVEPGDIIVGDDDGVVVVPMRITRKVIEQAETVALNETRIKQALDEGKTTLEILGLDNDEGGNP